MLPKTKINSTAIKKRVLFLCTGNSARSQIAEALLCHKASECFDVYSAGTHPESIDERTIAELEHAGIPTNSLQSNNIKDFHEQSFDYVITLCDQANRECRTFSGAKNQIAWDLPDPKTSNGLNPFSKTLNEINDRLTLFISMVNKQKELNVPLVNNTKLVQVDPIIFYKCLTDNIRLRTIMLTNYHGELCVCELMEALQENSQPKVSRNLAVLKKANIITDRKHGQWVFYQINTLLPAWVKNVISQTTENNSRLIQADISRLTNMRNRPGKDNFCR